MDKQIKALKIIKLKLPKQSWNKKSKPSNPKRGRAIVQIFAVSLLKFLCRDALQPLSACAKSAISLLPISFKTTR